MPSDARRNECALPGEIPKVGFWPISVLSSRVQVRPAAAHDRVAESPRRACAAGRRRRRMPRLEMSCWVLQEQ
jgi:hypothetical protein